MEWASAILSILAALVPPLVRWLERRAAGTLGTEDRHERELKELTDAVVAEDAAGIAAVFAERDRLLRIKGLRAP